MLIIIKRKSKCKSNGRSKAPIRTCNADKIFLNDGQKANSVRSFVISFDANTAKKAGESYNCRNRNDKIGKATEKSIDLHACVHVQR